MTEKDTFQEIRDKDHVVLQKIEEGHDDTQKITSNTTLENHHVNYSLQKLADLGLLDLSRPDTMVERVINGQKRVFQHPKQAALTEKAEQYLKDTEELEKYENLSHKELVEKVHHLENKIENLEKTVEAFRNQVKNLI